VFGERFIIKTAGGQRSRGAEESVLELIKQAGGKREFYFCPPVRDHCTYLNVGGIN